MEDWDLKRREDLRAMYRNVMKELIREGHGNVELMKKVLDFSETLPIEDHIWLIYDNNSVNYNKISSTIIKERMN